VDPSPDSRRTIRGGTFRVPVGLGCLVALVAMPIALLVGILTGLRALFWPTARVGTGPGPYRGARSGAAPSAVLGATGLALCSLVQKMSLDDDFSLEDAQMAGIPLDTEESIETLLADAVARGWIDRRADRFSVTRRGKAEADQLLRRMDR